MNIRLKDFDIENDNEFNFFTHLYNQSFPIEERRSISNIFYLLNHNKRYSIKVVVNDEDKLVGLLCYWTFDEFVYAEHLAIDTNVRGKGLGTKVMNCFVDEINKPLILEIEIPDNEISQRRLNFYLRQGFTYWEDLEYSQPPYHDTTSSVPMKLLTLGDLDLNLKFEYIKRFIYKQVYKVDDL